MVLDDQGQKLTLRAWQQFGDRLPVQTIEEISAEVSTNHVYRLVLVDGEEFIAKTTSYGSYVHFRQDHGLIQRWIQLLAGSRYADLLAPIAFVGQEVFTVHAAPVGIVFYRPAPYRDFLPRRLSDGQVDALGREMALFHAECARLAPKLPSSWKSVGSDIATLYDIAGNVEWLGGRGFGREAEHTIRRHCDLFLSRAEALGYHEMQRIPILIDWNIGNFSIRSNGDDFELFSRWDYDWFRLEPRTLDFYFCSRVVRDEGDQTTFTYGPQTLTSPRFVRFLRSYVQYFPLRERELLFLLETYRFFILNYVVRSGEHFFRPELCERLQREAVDRHLMELTEFSIEPLCEAVLR